MAVADRITRKFIHLPDAGIDPTEAGQFGRNGDNLVFRDSTGARTVPSLNSSNVMVLPAASRINIGNATNYSFSVSYPMNWAQVLLGGFVPYIKIENTCTEQDSYAGINVQCTGAGGYETRLAIQAIGQNIVSIPYFQGKVSIATNSLTQGGLALAVNHPSSTLTLHWVTGTAYDLTSERLTISASALVINEPGGNVDFRVEGDTEPNLIFVDASTDRVGIGTASPSSGYRLEVKGAVKVEDSSAGYVTVLARNTNSGTSTGAAYLAATTTDAGGDIFTFMEAFGRSYSALSYLAGKGVFATSAATDAMLVIGVKSASTIEFLIGGYAAGNVVGTFSSTALTIPTGLGLVVGSAISGRDVSISRDYAGILFGLEIKNINTTAASGAEFNLTASDFVGSFAIYDVNYTTANLASRLTILQSDRGINLMAGGSGGTVDIYADGTAAGNRTASFAAGTLEFPSAEIVYLGAPTTDGSWRFQRSGNNVIWERRESAVWVTKQTIAA